MDSQDTADSVEAFLQSTEGRYYSFVQRHTDEFPIAERPTPDVVAETPWVVTNDAFAPINGVTFVISFDDENNDNGENGLMHNITFTQDGEEVFTIIQPNEGYFGMLLGDNDNYASLSSESLGSLLNFLEKLEAAGHLQRA